MVYCIIDVQIFRNVHSKSYPIIRYFYSIHTIFTFFYAGTKLGYTFLRDNTLRVLSIKNEDNKFLFDNILKYRIVISISLFWVCTFCSFYTQLKWKIIMCAYKNVFVYLFIRKFHFMWVIYLIEYVVCILLKPRPSTSTSPSSLNWPSQQPVEKWPWIILSFNS